MTMRTAADFNLFYATPDPWRISHAKFRDGVLRSCISGLASGRSVLELGCGEGHLTEAVFDEAAAVTAIDISEVAIGRAKARNLRNAQFEQRDFLNMSFEGYDVIAAIECLYYLAPEDQEAFFEKLAREHRGLFLLSAPIIGENKYRRYFTHEQLMATFARHGFSDVKFHNINVHRRDILTTAAAIAARLAPSLLDWLPDSAVYQRCYIIRMM
jgi:cyclopropane fatty-acyl-phospholipid synthase-like methyltransferase